MNLPVPAVGLEPGPDWATDINNSLTIVDQHNHAPGSGVQITPSGILINTDLAFNTNSATTLLSSQYVPQVSAIAPLTAVYVIGRELYYNDGAGNSVQLTSNGSIAGATGSISGLVPPASASYSGSTFIWQSNVLTAANMDAGSVILRNITASSKGLTLNPPAAMSSDYSLVLPSLPVSTSFMTLDASGNMAGSISTSGGIVGSNIAALTITAAKIANATITTTQIASSTILLSNLATSARESVVATGSTDFLNNGVKTIITFPTAITNTSGSYNISNGQYTVPTTGFLDVASSVSVSGTPSGTTYLTLYIYNNGSEVVHTDISIPASGNPAGVMISLCGYGVTAGDIITIRAQYNGASAGLSNAYTSYSLR